MPNRLSPRPSRNRSLLAASALLLAASGAAALAQPSGVGQGVPESAPSARQNPIPGPVGNPETAAYVPAPGEPGFTASLWSRSNLLGDLYGVRTRLGNVGISLGLQEISEVFGNATGGIHRGAAYDGLTIMSAGLDTQKAFGLAGGTFNVSAFQIHGRNLSADNLLTLQTASGIEATRATRLWEIWYQQAFLDGRLDVKLGQQSLDTEFLGSQGSSLFINTAMGWPLVPSVDLYAGGPAYPLSSLGVRLRGQPMENLTLLGGVFNDNPPGGPFNDDSQVRGAEKSGTRFNLNTGALIIGEAQYAINPPPTDKDATPSGMPGLYKIGFWYDTARFPDQRFDTLGLSLADPNSSGDPRRRRNNWSVYGVADQMIWRPDPKGPRSLNVFARVMGAPGQQNLANFSANGGVTLKAPFPGRDDDTAGLGFGVARISGRTGGLDQDAIFFGSGTGVRSTETFVELTYQYVVAPWWQVQPDFQYVWTPSGGIANPLNPAKRVGNEAVFGVRTNITF